MEDAIVDMTICALERPDVRKRIADGMATYEATMEDAPLESERLRKEIKRIDAAFERIWQAIEDGIAPPGGKERIEDLKARKDALETEYQIAKANENIEPGFSELMDWLDNVAEEMNPQEILTMLCGRFRSTKPKCGCTSLLTITAIISRRQRKTNTR